MSTEFTLEDAYAKARKVARSIEASLPQKIEASELTHHSKIPFKALSVRETLIHRVSALASPALSLYDEGNVLAGIVLTRSVLETVAVTFALGREIERFLAQQNEDTFDQFLMACLVGSRWPDDSMQSRNVLTLIDRLDRDFHGYRATYDSLSEYAHPNWSGVLGSFGEIDHESRTINLGAPQRTGSITIGVVSLSMALGLFEYSYNEMSDAMQRLNSHYENAR